MYSVTAPAKSCAIPTDRSATTGKPVQARRDFKVIGGAHSSADFRKSLRKIDPGELASKILQLHAAADESDDTGLQRPNMATDTSDNPFEIPGVLRKSADAEKIADVVTRSAQKKQRAQNRPVKLPRSSRFRTLAAGTLLVGLAGGAALALGLPDMMISEEPVTRPVTTELIVAEPPVASAAHKAGTEGASGGNGQTSTGTADTFNTATPQQIAKAKDRLRLSIASGNTGIYETSAGASDDPVVPVYPQAPSDQTAIANVVPNTEVVVSNLTAVLSRPAYARPSSTETQSVQTVLPGNEAIAANNSPDVVLGDTVAGQTPVGPETEQGSGAYPHSGKTTASVNMRFSEQKNSKIIAVIPGDTAISFNECGKWWCGVEYEGKAGFVGQRFVNRTAQ